LIFEGRCVDGKSFRHIIDQKSTINIHLAPIHPVVNELTTPLSELSHGLANSGQARVACVFFIFDLGWVFPRFIGRRSRR
jgi:hypothetical protein